jgi:hypothetical protein
LRVVLDASAGLAVALGHEAAMPLLDHLESASLVVAPELYATEVANGLWNYVAAGQVTLDEASERLAIAISCRTVWCRPSPSSRRPSAKPACGSILSTTSATRSWLAEKGPR